MKLLPPENHVLALSGGVGGSKLALGLSRVLPAGQLSIVANTADDFEHLGLHISPDLDTLMYTLAGLNDNERGWGLAGETWSILEALGRLGEEIWFQLGDRDFATHVARTKYLRDGHTLSEVTTKLCRNLGISHPIIPMSDDPIRTQIIAGEQVLDFQHYFVRDRCEPPVSEILLKGIATAQPQDTFKKLLRSDKLNAIIIGPSNPFVSIDPIIKIPSIKSLMKESSAPVVAVSPIIGNESVKGPAAKMMSELGMTVSCLSIAEHYGSLLDGLVIDESDAPQEAILRENGLDVLVVPTLMRSLDDRIKLATDVLDFSIKLFSCRLG